MADIVTSRQFVDGERGITAQKLNDIVGSSVIQPAFYTSKPTAGSADPADIALILKAGAYAQVPISTLAGSATQAQIWSTRLRSFNAIGNPNFEVDQRNAGASFGFGAVIPAIDRWFGRRTGTMGGTLQQTPGVILVPGTNFCITGSYLRVALTTTQASLGTSDNLGIQQIVEGSYFRELSKDVHSLSLLVRSSVAGLNFGISLRDTAAAASLTKLCTIPVAGVWTLISLSNLPLWAAGGTFNTVPGSIGYYLNITLAAGSGTTSPANDTWQTGSFAGAIGQSNFAASPINSTFDLAMISHEPGALCTTFMDKPFTQNLDECLRYFQKSYDYDTALGTASAPGGVTMFPQSTVSAYGPVRFHKPMAKVPVLTAYNAVTGAINSLRLIGVGSDFAVTGFQNFGKSGFNGVAATSLPAPAVSNVTHLHYTADTGW